MLRSGANGARLVQPAFRNADRCYRLIRVIEDVDHTRGVYSSAVKRTGRVEPQLLPHRRMLAMGDISSSLRGVEGWAGGRR